MLLRVHYRFLLELEMLVFCQCIRSCIQWLQSLALFIMRLDLTFLGKAYLFVSCIWLGFLLPTTQHHPNPYGFLIGPVYCMTNEAYITHVLGLQ
uniref:Uncharacterized protein n=1 Tax=Rhizophora mucronata TaxID=61149 RepID=A0A2P2NKC6_RHIMU